MTTPQIERPQRPDCDMTITDGDVPMPAHSVYAIEAHADAVAEWRAAPLRAENEALRQCLSGVLAALGTGAGCTPTVSLEFMRSVEGEVRATVTDLRAENERLQRLVESVTALKNGIVTLSNARYERIAELEAALQKIVALHRDRPAHHVGDTLAQFAAAALAPSGSALSAQGEAG